MQYVLHSENSPTTGTYLHLFDLPVYLYINTLLSCTLHAQCTHDLQMHAMHTPTPTQKRH